MKKIERRTRLGWDAFGKSAHILKTQEIPADLISNNSDQCITPILTYVTQTRILTKQVPSRLRVTQRALAQAILGISLRDTKRNKWIRGKSEVKDIIETARQLRWEYAGHRVRGTCSTARGWQMRYKNFKMNTVLGKTRTKKPQTTWCDDPKKTIGLNWTREAHDKLNWKSKKA